MLQSAPKQFQLHLQNPYMHFPWDKQSPGQKILSQEFPPIVEFMHSQFCKGKLSTKALLHFFRQQTLQSSPDHDRSQTHSPYIHYPCPEQSTRKSSKESTTLIFIEFLHALVVQLWPVQPFRHLFIPKQDYINPQGLRSLQKTSLQSLQTSIGPQTITKRNESCTTSIKKCLLPIFGKMFVQQIDEFILIDPFRVEGSSYELIVKCWL